MLQMLITLCWMTALKNSLVIDGIYIGLCLTTHALCTHLVCMGLHISELTCTCQLFLYLCWVCISEQSHSLCDTAAAMYVLLVIVAFKGQVTEGGRGCVVDLWTGAAQQTHQGRDPIELQHLRDKTASGVSTAEEHNHLPPSKWQWFMPYDAYIFYDGLQWVK